MVSSEDARCVIHIHHPPSLQYFQFLSVEPATLRMFLSLNISRFLFTSIQPPFILLMNSLMVKRWRLKERPFPSVNIGRSCERHLSTRPVHACNRYIWWKSLSVRHGKITSCERIFWPAHHGSQMGGQRCHIFLSRSSLPRSRLCYVLDIVSSMLQTYSFLLKS